MIYIPKVSIVIPVYNGENYLREAIDSALAQTYKNIEIIVVNDGSTDDGATERIALSYGDKIRYFQKENGGVSSALNYGIQKMQGEYFSWLSHDDVYLPNKIEKEVELAEKFDERTIVCCGCSYIDKDANLLKQVAPAFYKEGRYDWQDALKILLQHFSKAFSGCALLIPKTAFENCGEFNKELRFCQDVFMWYKIFLQRYAFVYIPDRLVQSRVHGKQLTQTGQDLFKEEIDKVSLDFTARLMEEKQEKYNFVSIFLISYAKFLSLQRIKQIITLSKPKKLISPFAAMKAYLLCTYGKVRPLIRKIYYRLFKKIKVQ